MRALRRDPFARITLVRAVHNPAHGETCSWCGSLQTSRRCRAALLFRYGTESDAIRARIFWHRGAFCSLSCHDAYNDVA
jgi:hypothetical protein